MTQIALFNCIDKQPPRPELHSAAHLLPTPNYIAHYIVVDTFLKMAPSIDQLQLPKSTITHIMKTFCNEDNVSFQKDARIAVSRAAVVFISYVASAAADLSTRKDHRFTSADVIQALRTLDLEDIARAIEAPVREHEGIAKAKRQKRAEIMRQKAADSQTQSQAEPQEE